MTDRPADTRGDSRFDPNYDEDVLISREMVDEGARLLEYYEAIEASRDTMAREVYRAMARMAGAVKG